jgi:transposase
MTELVPIIEAQILLKEKTTIYSDYFRSYDGLADLGYKRHFRIKHSDNQFANGKNHINGIENFWGLCKVRLSRFRGIHKHKFYLHLKECEFRYNNRDKNLYFCLMKSFRNYPLKLS